MRPSVWEPKVSGPTILGYQIWSCGNTHWTSSLDWGPTVLGPTVWGPTVSGHQIRSLGTTHWTGGLQSWDLQPEAYKLGLPDLELGKHSLDWGPTVLGPTVWAPTVSGYQIWSWKPLTGLGAYSLGD